LFGTLIGFAGAIAMNNFAGTEVTPEINLILILSVLAGSFLIGGIAGIIPALNAAKQNPVEALRS
jgi:ABC-type antimicrobial peptide transport system permease subunit